VTGDPATRPTMARGEVEEREHRLRDAVAAFDARVELLADGGIVVELPATEDPKERAAVAARCALALRGVLPEASIGLCGAREPGTPALERAIDRGVRVLEKLSMRAIFAGPLGQSADRGINVDEAIASLLDRKFEVERAGKAYILHGERQG